MPAICDDSSDEEGAPLSKLKVALAPLALGNKPVAADNSDMPQGGKRGASDGKPAPRVPSEPG
jgi:hypothetical protein